MFANYHTHTWRCKHAVGTEREYVEAAIDGGMKILGFSDHTPMPYDGGYVSNVKMSMDQLEGYVDTVEHLKAEYRDQIEIHLGLEVEYYPAYFDRLLEATSQYPIEYFLLGQHFLGNEIEEPIFNGTPTASADRLVRYCRQTKEALSTGCFTYFAHPDLLNYTGDRAFYQEQIRDLCEFSKELDIPLEINFLGLWDHRNYPNRAFWEIAGQVGNRVILGCDAHSPDRVWDPETLLMAEQIVRDYHLNRIDTAELRKPVRS